MQFGGDRGELGQKQVEHAKYDHLKLADGKKTFKEVNTTLLEGVWIPCSPDMVH